MDINQVWQFSTAGAIKFGRGSRAQLVEQLVLRGLRRPLLVTDRTLSSLEITSQFIGEVTQAVDEICVFEDGEAEPTVDVAIAACEAGKAAKADCVIGLGGGSNIDLAKVAATVLAHGGAPSKYFGFDAIPGPVLPLIALPTTAGTGSEVSHSAVLTDSANQIKVSTLSPWLRPMVAIVDPDFTDSCPPRITAHSGIDALVHAIEAYTNRDYKQMTGVDPQARAYEGSYPLTRLLAAEAIRLVGRALVVACQPDSDQPGSSPVPGKREARDEMALAALLAGMAFSNSGVGIVHALEYPIGALTHCGHGEGNGLLLPHVMRFNLPARSIEFADIARWLGAEVVGLSQRKTAEAAIDSVNQLLHLTGIRTHLSELGLSESDIPAVAEKAFGIKRLMDVNPQPVTQMDLESILTAAF